VGPARLADYDGPMPPTPLTSRRHALCALAALPALARGAAPLLTRPLPAGGEALPLVGLGSWITFNVGNDPQALAACTEVMRAFFGAGGRMVDSSPMYGSAQATIGHALKQLRDAPVFSADKVWVSPGSRGPAQVEASRRLWGVPRFDLLQVHNLLAWEEHLPMLQQMKAAGRLRHVGITTSEGRRHADIERIMRSQAIDFVQLSYNLLDRDVEQRLLPLAQERRIGVIVNRPFRQGALLDALQRHKLPGWAAELGCDSWAQAALKFVISHPAVSCAIPATTRVDHVLQNLGASRGRLPDAALRQRMAADVKGLLA
jgi:diketogulonate reductase-like aldo/keto reductase